jgi:hypothetical protein
MNGPSYANGFARDASTSLHPSRWRGLRGLWVPELHRGGSFLWDWSPYNNHGTFTGGLPNSSWTLTSEGYCIDHVAATEANITCAHQQQVDIIGPLTVVARIRFTTAQIAGLILAKWRSTGNNRAYTIGADPFATDGKLMFTAQSKGSSTEVDQIASSAGEYNDGQWHTVIGVFAPSTRTEIWVDGFLDGTAVSPGAAIASVAQPITIGSSGANTTDWFDGQIGLCAIYGRAFTPRECFEWHQDPLGIVRLAPRRARYVQAAVTETSLMELAGVVAAAGEPSLSTQAFMDLAGAVAVGLGPPLSAQVFMQAAGVVAAGGETSSITKAYVDMAGIVAAGVEPSLSTQAFMDLAGAVAAGLGPSPSAKVFMELAGAAAGGYEPSLSVRAYLELAGVVAGGYEPTVLGGPVQVAMQMAAIVAAGGEPSLSTPVFMELAGAVAAGIRNSNTAKAYMEMAGVVAAGYEPTVLGGPVQVVMELAAIVAAGQQPLPTAKAYMQAAGAVAAGIRNSTIAKAYMQTAGVVAAGMGTSFSTRAYMQMAAAVAAGAEPSLSTQAFMEAAGVVAAGMRNSNTAQAFMELAGAVAAGHEGTGLGGTAQVVMEMAGIVAAGFPISTVGGTVQVAMEMAGIVAAGGSPDGQVSLLMEMAGIAASGSESIPTEKVFAIMHRRRGAISPRAGRSERIRPGG